MLLFSCLADTGHCLGFLNCMSLFLHFHFWKLFEESFFFNGLATQLQFLLSFEKTAGVPLHHKSCKNGCWCTTRVKYYILFYCYAKGSNPNLFLSQLTMTASDRHAILFNWEFYVIISQNASHGPAFQHKCPNEKNGQETEWHFVLSVCVCVCACLWHWKGQKKVRLIEWDCCRKKGKIERFLKSPVRWR